MLYEIEKKINYKLGVYLNTLDSLTDVRLQSRRNSDFKKTHKI
jgi:hypothetical protein